MEARAYRVRCLSYTHYYRCLAECPSYVLSENKGRMSGPPLERLQPSSTSFANLCLSSLVKYTLIYNNRPWQPWT